MNFIITEVGVVHGSLVEISGDVVSSPRVGVPVVVDTSGSHKSNIVMLK
jgi:hypothetical protein